MAIHFSMERWSKLREPYALWWKRGLDRPIVKLTIKDSYAPDREKPPAPLLSQKNCHDFSFSPEEIIDRIDYELSKNEYLGDAFPFVNLDCFGPGVLSAFCGARLDNSSGRVWFFPEENLPISEITVKYDPDNKWVRRIKSIYAAGNDRWGGMVLMGMPDLGGVLDIAAIFRGSEELLMDLYDEPEEVARLCGEVETAWHEAYRDLLSALAPVCPGYSDWLGVYSEKPSYVLQSDFSYMIGNGMFKEFALPSIRRACAEIPNTVYHLDGVGQLAHLDDLLAIEELNAIQWVYGDGQPGPMHWLEVYQKIADAGKGSKVEGAFDEFASLAPIIRRNLCYSAELPYDRREDALGALEQYLPR